MCVSVPATDYVHIINADIKITNRLTHSRMSRSLSGCAITSRGDQLSMLRTSSKLIVNVRSSVAMTGWSVSAPSAAPTPPPPSGDMSGRVTKNSMHSAADDSVAMQSELSLLNVALICMKRLKNAVGIFSSALQKQAYDRCADDYEVTP